MLRLKTADPSVKNSSAEQLPVWPIGQLSGLLDNQLAAHRWGSGHPETLKVSVE